MQCKMAFIRVNILGQKKGRHTHVTNLPTATRTLLFKLDLSVCVVLVYSISAQIKFNAFRMLYECVCVSVCIRLLAFLLRVITRCIYINIQYNVYICMICTYTFTHGCMMGMKVRATAAASSSSSNNVHLVWFNVIHSAEI